MFCYSIGHYWANPGGNCLYRWVPCICILLQIWKLVNPENRQLGDPLLVYSFLSCNTRFVTTNAKLVPTPSLPLLKREDTGIEWRQALSRESILEYYSIIMGLVNCNFISRLRIWLTLFTLVQPSFYFNKFYRTIGSITSRCFRVWASVHHSLGEERGLPCRLLRYSSRFPKKSAWEARPGNRA